MEIETYTEKRGREKLKGKKYYHHQLLFSATQKGRGRGRGGGGSHCSCSSTPVVSWKEEETENSITKGKGFFLPFSFPFFGQKQVSARKLAAAFWEFQQYFSMYRHLHNNTNKDDHHEPESATNLRRHITTSLTRYNQSAARNHHSLQLLSPASHRSSLEMAPYNPAAATPESSIEIKGRISESSYGFKTSTELLKLLNRIWTLEEKHASNKSLVKALKHELSQARAKIKDLVKDQQANRSQTELENERKLRKRSESLHRKLARELFEVKAELSTTTKELEKERKSSEVLVELCDEFAKGVKKQRSDDLLLRVSETWLEERMQAKGKDLMGVKQMVEKLRHEIENGSNMDPNETRIRRCSLESIPETEKYNEQEEIVLMSGKKKGQITPPSLQMSDIYDSVNGGVHRVRRNTYYDEGEGSNSKTVDRLMSELLLSEEYGKEGISKNSLKAKLREPKTKGHHRSRVKILKGSS